MTVAVKSVSASSLNPITSIGECFLKIGRLEKTVSLSHFDLQSKGNGLTIDYNKTTVLIGKTLHDKYNGITGCYDLKKKEIRLVTMNMEAAERVCASVSNEGMFVSAERKLDIRNFEGLPVIIEAYDESTHRMKGYYEGDLDENNNPHGFGVIKWWDEKWDFTVGTFANGHAHGIWISKKENGNVEMSFFEKGRLAYYDIFIAHCGDCSSVKITGPNLNSRCIEISRTGIFKSDSNQKARQSICRFHDNPLPTISEEVNDSS